LRLKQKGMLCVRSPKTAHTRRPARRITCPSVPPAARGSGPAAAQEAAGPPQNVASAGKRRDAIAFRAALSGFVHARRFSFWLPPPWAFGPRPGASPLVAPSRAALQAAPTPALRGTSPRRAVFENKARSTCRRLVQRPRVVDSASPRRRKCGSLRQPARQETCHAGCEVARLRRERAELRFLDLTPFIGPV